MKFVKLSMFALTMGLFVASCGNSESTESTETPVDTMVAAPTTEAAAALDTAAAMVDSAAAKVDTAAAKVEAAH